MATPNASDMGQYFDFGEAAVPDVQQGASQQNSTIQLGEGYLTQKELQDITNTSAEFNTDFSTHLPRYQKPAHSCDYCRSKGLECFIYDCDGSGRVRCSPCNALFRPCSFTDVEKSPAFKQNTALDTLDVVGEDDERCFGGLTGKKQMRSLGHMGPIDDDNNQGEERPKKGAAAARFPRPALKVLKDWMMQHFDHPYPTDEDKELLKQQTGLSIGQISNWMANTRRRQKARPKRSSSPSIRPSTEAIDIPAGRTWESLSTYTKPETRKAHKFMASAVTGRFLTFRVTDGCQGGAEDPFERWKHSPPENEPAPMTAIAQAVEKFGPPEAASRGSSYRKGASNDSTSSMSIFQAPSVSSLETGLTGMSSGSLGSHNSAYSYGSRHSLGSMNSLKSKERRRRRRLPTRAPKADPNEASRLFQCTFCTDRFKSKYDWSRHEKSLHLSLEKWICAPLGPIIVDKATGKRKCVYCDDLEPTDEHLAAHNHGGCEEKGLESRTFYRKDHLRQHLRLMHGCKMTASMEPWKSEAQYIKSRCGFCQMSFDKWQDRIDHLAKEFRNGADMKTWKGCRGLDAHVAIHVTNAMPPYLIANESKSPFPFSASNSSSLKQTHMQLETKDLEYLLPSNMNMAASADLGIAYQGNPDSNLIRPILLSTPQHYSASEHPLVNPNATCWEILTLRLGRFARQYIEKHGVASMTDEMLQNEARVILYGEADGWEQTAADNPEWLNLFKKAHGIDITAPVTGITAHHEIYEDLGIHSNSILDPSFNVENFSVLSMSQNHPDRAVSFECALSGTTNLTNHARQISSGRQSPRSIAGPSGSSSLSPTSLNSRISATTGEQIMGVYAPIPELACTGPDGPCYGENGELGFSIRQIKGSGKKSSYWRTEDITGLTSFNAQCSAAGESIYECAKVGLKSFSPLDEQACLTEEFQMPSIEEHTCTDSDMAVVDANTFDFPSWDQLPEDFQNPTTSADFYSTIPISASGSNAMAWDNDDMNFAMDMDLDLDLDLNVFGKC
ncbi:hypothetical protein CC86DRAFT_391553 [Ophiobolus disseminans]|uniref:Uncharacterized protein n=1 Tax=Ophiobolus disseminans TaxID=1469910 RepID=A0A6A7ACU6_9PLEO|nr:hypothetical protein CC86DRAFT_391553 [Ophiobolus disseminans]